MEFGSNAGLVYGKIHSRAGSSVSTTSPAINSIAPITNDWKVEFPGSYQTSTAWSIHYLDAKFVIDGENAGGAENTYFCGASSLPCHDCHPSCAGSCNMIGTCEANTCAGNYGVLETKNYICHCKGVEINNDYGCTNPCHPSCDGCDDGGDVSKCAGCKNPGATLDTTPSGTCMCDETSPTEASCTCLNGCAYCLGSGETYCWKSGEAFAFAHQAIQLDPALPYTTLTHGTVCYRDNLSDAALCAEDALNHVAGVAAGGTFTPTRDTCHAVLDAMWPSVKYWYSTIFNSPFDFPVDSTFANQLKIKTVLQQWIYHFDATSMQTDVLWLAIVNLFNNLSAGEWATVMAWGGANPQYSVDGNNQFDFPAPLKAWLMHSEGDLAAFNTFTTVCEAPACGKAHCAHAFPKSMCGFSKL